VQCKHAHLYRSASAPGWLAPQRVTSTPTSTTPTVTGQPVTDTACVTDNLVVFTARAMLALQALYSVPYNEIGIRESNDDVRTLTGSS